MEAAIQKKATMFRLNVDLIERLRKLRDVPAVDTSSVEAMFKSMGL